MQTTVYPHQHVVRVFLIDWAAPSQAGTEVFSSQFYVQRSFFFFPNIFEEFRGDLFES